MPGGSVGVERQDPMLRCFRLMAIAIPAKENIIARTIKLEKLIAALSPELYS